MRPANLRTFAAAFFAAFGAEVFPEGADMLVLLTPELAEHFGKPRLYLTFADELDGEDRSLSPTEDLLAYGSKTFDLMLALLAGRGRKTACSLKPQLPLELETPFPPLAEPPAPSLMVTSAELNHRRFYAFHFRVVYLWAEKEEAALTVLLDEAGKPLPEAWLGLLTGAALTAPPALPGQDQAIIEQMAERAGEVAHRLLRARAEALQVEIESRLQKIQARLDSFYRRLMEESASGDEAKDAGIRAELEADLARKLADEVERHQLQVSLTPVSWAEVFAPVGRHALALETGGDRHTLNLRRDLVFGAVEAFECATCGADVIDLITRPDSACPLNRWDVGWPVLAMAGLPVEVSAVPQAGGLKRERYSWRRVFWANGTIAYVGQAQAGWLLFKPGAALLLADTTGKIVFMRVAGLMDRLRLK